MAAHVGRRREALAAERAPVAVEAAVLVLVAAAARHRREAARAHATAERAAVRLQHRPTSVLRQRHCTRRPASVHRQTHTSPPAARRYRSSSPTTAFSTYWETRAIKWQYVTGHHFFRSLVLTQCETY